MDKKVDITGWIKWLWSLWPAGWIGLSAIILNAILSLSVGQWCGCGPIGSFILSFILIGMAMIIIGLLLTLIVCLFLDAWPGIKKRTKRWWERRPQ